MGAGTTGGNDTGPLLDNGPHLTQRMTRNFQHGEPCVQFSAKIRPRVSIIMSFDVQPRPREDFKFSRRILKCERCSDGWLIASDSAEAIIRDIETPCVRFISSQTENYPDITDNQNLNRNGKYYSWIWIFLTTRFPMIKTRVWWRDEMIGRQRHLLIKPDTRQHPRASSIQKPGGRSKNIKAHEINLKVWVI